MPVTLGVTGNHQGHRGGTQGDLQDGTPDRRDRAVPRLSGERTEPEPHPIQRLDRIPLPDGAGGRGG